eukprot:300241-Chlamydomonas_euryale.AAC.1
MASPWWVPCNTGGSSDGQVRRQRKVFLRLVHAQCAGALVDAHSWMHSAQEHSWTHTYAHEQPTHIQTARTCMHGLLPGKASTRKACMGMRHEGMHGNARGRHAWACAMMACRGMYEEGMHEHAR